MADNSISDKNKMHVSVKFEFQGNDEYSNLAEYLVVFLC
jgi:hypothetical protein